MTFGHVTLKFVKKINDLKFMTSYVKLKMNNSVWLN